MDGWGSDCDFSNLLYFQNLLQGSVTVLIV